jgi:tetratricopeptide (TPR) repeat protein
MACLDDDTLVTLAAGGLSGVALEAAEAHLDGCPRCRRALALGLEGAEGGAAPQLSIGDTIGRYIVLERVGAGAMGQVFAAWDPQLDRKVALKLLRPGVSDGAHDARLLREAQTLARLSHPNVVSVFDVGRWEGQRFVTLEFISGGSLRQHLERRRREAGALGWREVVQRFVEAGRGLSAAHGAGVIHRDVKPDNLLVRDDGRVLVTDFGLASEADGRLVDGPALAHGLSLTGTRGLLGTPAYMAPAQLDGAPATAASDQFSLCVALFEALTGVRPWVAETVETLRAAQRAGPPVFPSGLDLPPSLRRAVLRGLSVDERERWPSMDALVAQLEAALAPPRFNPVRAAAFAVVLVALSALVLQRRPLPEACALGQARLEATWSPARRAALEQAFLASKLPWAPAAASSVAQAFDARLQAWRAQHLEACLASGASAAKVWSARLSCLEERVLELDATLATLEAGGAEAVTRASRVVDRLPATSVCMGAEVTERMPSSEAEQAEHRRARALAARAATLYELGAYDAVEKLSSPGDAGTPLVDQAFVWSERGRALQRMGRLEEAQQTLRAAALASTSLGEADLASGAYSELSYVVGYLVAKPDEATPWVELARAWLPGTRDSRPRERLESALGNIETRRGRLEAAQAHFELQVELTAARTGEQSAVTARALINLANGLVRQRRFDEARPLIERAVTQLSTTLGPQHPDSVQAQNSLAAVLAEQGQLEASVGWFKAVFEGYRAALGDTHPNLVTAAFNVAEASERLGRPAEAAPWYETALGQATAVMGPRAAQRVGPLAGLGRCALATNDVVRAEALAREALGRCDEGGCEPEDEGAAASLLVEVLVARPDRRREAEAVAKRARASWATLKATPQLEKLDALMKR